jgi:hypothetical protein
VNAPLAGILSGDLDRCLFDDNGDEITTLEESLAFIESKRLESLPEVKKKEKKEKPEEKAYKEIKNVKEGGRHNAMISYAGKIANPIMLNDDELEALLREFCPFDDPREADKEIKDALKFIEKKRAEGNGSRFSNLRAIVPEHQSTTQEPRFLFSVDGHDVEVKGGKALQRVATVRGAIMDQALIDIQLTAPQWETIRTDLTSKMLATKDDDGTDDDSIFSILERFLYRDLQMAIDEREMEDKRRLGSDNACVIDGRIVFDPIRYVKHINDSKAGVSFVSRSKLLPIYKAHGGETKLVRYGKSPSDNGRFWTLPFDENRVALPALFGSSRSPLPSLSTSDTPAL